MRKILWAVVIVLIISVVSWTVVKIVPSINLKKDIAGVQTTNTEPVIQIEGTNLFLTENGQIITQSSSKKPLLYLDKSLKLTSGQKVTDPQILFAGKIAAGLAKSDFSVASIRLLPSADIAVYNPQNAIAVFSADKDAKNQIDSLQQVLAKAKIDAAKIVKIDLRFDQPVITFK